MASWRYLLSSFRPVSVLKGAFKKSASHFNIRKILVVSQFSFAVVLIISTLVVIEQIEFTKSREREYNSEQLIYHWITGDLEKNYPALKNELIQSGVASSVTKTLSPFSMIMSDTWDLEWQGKHPGDKTDFERLSADEDIVQTASLRLIRDVILTRKNIHLTQPGCWLMKLQ
jgi:putative ABC transport system permease protein